MSNENQWPIKHPTTNRPDGRWSITKEYTGAQTGKSFVFRFCDNFISAHEHYTQALNAANEHATQHFKKD